MGSENFGQSLASDGSNLRQFGLISRRTNTSGQTMGNCELQHIVKFHREVRNN